jgi:glutathione S-transferase
MFELMRAESRLAPYAPPFLKSGALLIAQTANILSYLGPRLGLVPSDERRRLGANQLQLTIADLASEAHDVHHPIASSLYYEDQKREARRRASSFVSERIPKYLGYFERELDKNGGRWLIGRSVSYVDLSMLQVVDGLTYAFPNAMKRMRRKTELLHALADRVRQRPRIAAYLASPRRCPFGESDLFRHYPELDA